MTSKKLKARLDSLLSGITSTYVLKTDNATETVAGITKIATQSEINAGTDDSKLVTSKKLASMLNSKLSTYIKNTDVATETKAGIITEARIKEIAPQTDLTPYVPFAKGFRNQNSTDWFVRTNNHTTSTGYIIDMYNGDNNQFMGAFHTNGHNAFYKVPNRNGGNWNRILDEHDLNNLNTTVNQIVGSYVRDLRLSGLIIEFNSHERPGYVTTSAWQMQGEMTKQARRALQMNRGENWYNVPFA